MKTFLGTRRLEKKIRETRVKTRAKHGITEKEPKSKEGAISRMTILLLLDMKEDEIT